MSKEFEQSLIDTVEAKQNTNVKKTVVKKKKNKKGIIVGFIAGVLAGAVAIGCFLGFKKKKTKLPTQTSNSISISVNDIGVEEEIPVVENNQFEKVTGNIKQEDLVEKNGTTWKDQNAANKSDNVGTVIVDTKNDTLKVQPDGEVIEKDIDYVVKDTQGNTIEIGSNENGAPNGFVYDDGMDSYVEVEDAYKYITLEADYYDMSGNLVFSMGEVVTREAYERIKAQFIAHVPQTTTPNYGYDYNQPSYTQPNYGYDYNQPSYDYNQNNGYVNNSNADSYGGVINPDGTYTIYGTTYADKATFEAIALGEADDVQIIDGVIYLKGSYQKQR